jgi:SOS-response transcriptional repressor LexA
MTMADGSKKAASEKAPTAPDGLPVSGKFLKGAFALRVRGDSMVAPAGQWPTFPPDCIIIIDPDRKAEPGCYVLVEFKDGRTSFKKLEMYKGFRKKWLVPLNPIYVPSRLPDDARVVGVVVQVEIHTELETGKRLRAERQAAAQRAAAA